MNKRYLSQQQKQHIQQQYCKQPCQLTPGLVVAHYGDRLELKTHSDEIFTCNIRQNLPAIVVGDFVNWSLADAATQTGIVVALEPRRNVMWRRNQRGETKLIAANIDYVVVVIAAGLNRTAYVLDRYLVMTQLQNLPVLILFNKVDLLDIAALAAKQADYSHYEKLGYSTLFCSNVTQHSMELLAHVLQSKTSVLVGLSGVGKSSLIKALLPDEKIKIGALSSAGSSAFGKHTTTTARLYPLLRGGNVIDSPGIREFAIEGLTTREIQQGFREFLPYLDLCKFRNCQHVHEPGCAVRHAVENKTISQTRWQAYLQILNPLGGNA